MKKKITLLSSLEYNGHNRGEELLVSELESCGFLVKSKPWETLEDEGEDLFIVRTTWNYTEHYEKFIKRLEPIMGRLWNPLSLIKWNADKSYLHELYKKGLGVIPLSMANNKKSLIKSMDLLGGDEFIAKPILGASAKGLVRFNRSNIPDLGGKTIIQRFYPEIKKGEISLVYFNGRYAYSVLKTPKTGEIRVQEEYGGKVSVYSPTPEEFRLAEEVLTEIPFKWLYARVDIVPGVGLIELECIEPGLFFNSCEQAVNFFSKAIAELS